MDIMHFTCLQLTEEVSHHSLIATQGNSVQYKGHRHRLPRRDGRRVTSQDNWMKSTIGPAASIQQAS
jgi:hypothetical protein